MSFIKSTILGNVGNLDKAVELHHTPTGTPYCSFYVAADSYKGGEAKTVWVRCTFWGKSAETAAKYAEKGKQIYVEGNFSESEWTDRDGQKRHTNEISVTHWEWTGEGLSALFRESEKLETRAMQQQDAPFAPTK